MAKETDAIPTDEEIVFVAKAMDDGNEHALDWDSHPERCENVRVAARKAILAYRACQRLGEVQKPKAAADPDLVKESNVGGDPNKLGKGERWETAAENRAADRADKKAQRP
jgi:hypothetical protein